MPSKPTEDPQAPAHVVAACTATLLDRSAHPGQLRDAANRLADLFTVLAGFKHDPTAPSPTGETIYLGTGKAISPYDAALCLRDFRRSTCFLRGIDDALHALRGHSSARPVRVLYAGCGPFATLLVPLLHRYRPEEIRLTLLDINRASLDCCRQLVQRLNLGEHVDAFVCEDATRYRHDPTVPLHLVVTETLQAALAKECQVAITANLAPQLCPSGFLIPECIRLEAVLFEPAVEFSLKRMQGGNAASEHLRLGTAFEMNRHSAGAVPFEGPTGLTDLTSIPGGTVEVPVSMTASQEVFILTELTVFRNHHLEPYASGLTLPKLAHLDRSVRGGEAIRFRYIAGPTPHLIGEVLT